MSDDTKKPTRKKAAPAEAKPPGRPSKYTTELADEIVERLSEGEPLRQICRDERMPSWSAVYRWMEADATFSERIAGGRARGFDAIASECLDIADHGLNDTYIDEQGNKRTETDVIQRSKLRIETRLKLLAKWDPKRYGDKQTTELTGPNGGPVEFTGITRRIVKANE